MANAAPSDRRVRLAKTCAAFFRVSRGDPVDKRPVLQQTLLAQQLLLRHVHLYLRRDPSLHRLIYIKIL